MFLWCAQVEPSSEAAAAETKTSDGDAAKDEGAGDNLDKGEPIAPAEIHATASTAPAADVPNPVPLPQQLLASQDREKQKRQSEPHRPFVWGSELARCVHKYKCCKPTCSFITKT